MNNPNNVVNRPIGCTFCGATVQGQVVRKSTDPRTKKTINECRWVCRRCMNLVKTGPLAD